jgi:hypothetical protein
VGLYLTAELITRFAIVPLAAASLLSGIVQSLGTAWGLFRYYWVVVKLFLTVLAILVLLRYAQTVSDFADAAAATDRIDLDGLRSYLLHSVGGVLVLLMTTVLAVYKPRGTTPYGWRKQHERTVLAVALDGAPY